MAYAVEDLSTVTEPGLLALWRSSLPVVGDVAQKLRWAYRSAPAGAGEALVVVHREPGQADAVVGCAGLQRREFAARGHGELVPVGLHCDFAVDAQHRSGLPALLLQRAMARHARTRYPLSYGFPNSKAIAIFERLGYQRLGECRRYSRVLHYERYVRRVVDLHGATRAAGLVLDAAAALKHAPRLLSATLHAKVEWLDAFDERFDGLWARAREAWPLLGRRDAAQLAWRFGARPGAPMLVAAMPERRSGALAGYAVIERVGEHAHVRDVLALGESALEELLELVAMGLRMRGMDSVSLSFLGAPRVIAALEAAGFHERESLRSVIVDVGAGAPLPAEQLRDPASWYLTDGDEDT